VKRQRIRHVTGFHYDGEVTASYNEARMLPVSSDGQLVLYSNIEILPISSSHSYVDYWGTRVSSFEIITPHSELSLTATSLVEVRQRDHPEHRLTWDTLADEIEKATQYVEQLEQTPRTLPPPEVVQIARDIVATASTPCDAALQISQAIGDRIEYMSGVTGVHTTAAEAWE
jgi:transglutaminase-like putative cysteine protease